MAHWYAVKRRYRVEDTCYVQALTAKEAKEKVKNGEYEDASSPESIPGSDTAVTAERRRGVPRWLWEQMGCPDNVVID